MGKRAQRIFTCDRCNIDVTLDGLAEQPAGWSAIQQTRPPLAVFESERTLLCAYCTNALYDFMQGPGDAQIAAVFDLPCAEHTPEALRGGGDSADTTTETETQWCYFYGGQVPGEAACTAPVDDPATAEETLQWLKEPAGVGRRTVTYGPWQVTAYEGERHPFVPTQGHAWCGGQLPEGDPCELDAAHPIHNPAPAAGGTTGATT